MSTVKGFFLTTFSFLSGLLPEFSENLKSDITFLFQNTAFVVTIVVGIITIIKTLKRKK